MNPMDSISELEYQILENICTWEGVDHPECIGDENEVAKQFEIPVEDATRALRNLKAFGLIEECKARHSKHHDEKLAIEIGIFDPESSGAKFFFQFANELEDLTTDRAFDPRHVGTKALKAWMGRKQGPLRFY